MSPLLDAEAIYLAGAYAVQQARKAKAAALAAARAVKAAAARAARAVTKAVKTVARVAVTVGKAAYKVAGIQNIVSCVTDPSVAGCVQAGISLAMDVSVVANGGTDAAAVVGEEALEEGVVGAGEAAAEGAAEEGSAATEAGSTAPAAGDGVRFSLLSSWLSARCRVLSTMALTRTNRESGERSWGRLSCGGP